MRNSLRLVVLLAVFAGSAIAQAPDLASRVSLEETPGLLKKEEEKLSRKIDSVRAAVEEEAIAKRVSEPVAQSLRWSLRSAGSGVIADARGILGSARVPTDNAVLTQAFKELETVNTAVQARRGSLLEGAIREEVERTREVVRNATQPADIDNLKLVLARLREGFRELTSANSYNAQNTWEARLALLGRIKRLIEAAADGNPELIAEPLSQLQYSLNGDPDVGPELNAQVDRIVAPYRTKLKEKQSALDAAFKANKPYPEILKSMEDYSNAFDQARRLRSPYGAENDSDKILQIYRAFVTLGALRGMEDEKAFNYSCVKAENAVAQLHGKGSDIFDALLIRWKRESIQIAAQLRKNRVASVRARLEGAKTPADLEPVAEDLYAWYKPPDHLSDESKDQPVWETVSTIAAAWSSNNIALLGEANAKPPAAFASALSQLRGRVHREVLSHVLRAPELLAPELIGEPVQIAVEKLGDQLAKKGEWRRLYRLLEAHNSLTDQADTSVTDATLVALRLYFIAQNFEIAERWPDAVQAYKGILISLSEQTPIKPAAERLRALEKEHPEAFAGVKGASQAQPASR